MSQKGGHFRSRGVTTETDVPDCGRRRKPFVTRAMAACHAGEFTRQTFATF